MADDTIYRYIFGPNGLGTVSPYPYSLVTYDYYSGDITIDYSAGSVIGSANVTSVNGGTSETFANFDFDPQGSGDYAFSEKLPDGAFLNLNNANGFDKGIVYTDYQNGSSNYNSLNQSSQQTVINETPCFVQGSLIKTANGNIAVEHLSIGDLIVTTSGALRPIRWLGHRTVDCRRHPRSNEILPIRIAVGAFASGQPERDLLLSPGHAVCADLVGEVLVPVSTLVNGATITREDVERVTYWHVELESGHDVILAEGLACESYLDMGNRGFFAEAETTTLHAMPDVLAATHAAFCRPFHANGLIVDFLRDRLVARAEDLGWARADAGFAGLHLMVDGARLEPEADGLSAGFLVPAGALEVWIVTKTASPRDLAIGHDARDLGICIGAMTISDGFTSRTIAADDPRLCVGFNDLEAGPQRWTAGRARLPAVLWNGCLGAFVLRVDLTRPALPVWERQAISLKEERAA